MFYNETWNNNDSVIKRLNFVYIASIIKHLLLCKRGVAYVSHRYKSILTKSSKR